MQQYHERLAAPVTWWAAGIAFGAVWGWVALVVSTWTAAVVVALLVALASGAALWRYGHAVVLEVDDNGLRAGAAHLDAAALGPASALDRAATREALGPGADVRAWLLIRPYVPSTVRVLVDDASDPTPYWLISTRHPHALVTALESVTVRGETDGSQEV